MVNGIPCQIKTQDKDGKFTVLETCYFATFRKCPELAEYPKKLMKLETQGQKLKRQYAIVTEQISQAGEDELDALCEKLDAVQDKMSDIETGIYDTFREFVLKGLVAAGNEPADAERYASYLDYKSLPELLQKARLGAGRVDFF